MNARVVQSLRRLLHLKAQSASRGLSVGSVVGQQAGYVTYGANQALTVQSIGIGTKPFWNKQLHGQQSQVSSTRANSTQSKRRPADNKTPSFSELLLRLETYYKQQSYLSYEQYQRLVQVLLNESVHSGEPPELTKNQELFLLGGCVPELLPAQTVADRLTLFQRIWQHIATRKRLGLQHYQTRLQVLRSNRIPLANPNELLNELAACVALSDSQYVEVYTALLDVACAVGNMRQATELIANMRDRKFALTEQNFDALLLGHARNRDLPGAQSVLDSMVAAGMELNTDTYAVLTLAYLENDEPAKALDLLQRFHGQFDARQLLRILRSAVHGNVTPDVVELLVQELPKEYVSNSVDVPGGLRSLCVELVHTGKHSLVKSIIAKLPVPHFNANQNVDSFGTFLLQELFQAGVALPQIIELAQLLYASGKNTRALHQLAEQAMRRHPESAIACLEELQRANEPLRPHYFWPLLMHNLRRHGEHGIILTLGEMSRLKVECDYETIHFYVLPNLKVSLEQPVATLKKLDECGVRISQVLVPVMMQLLQQQRVDEVQQLSELYTTRLTLQSLMQPLANLAVHMRATKQYQVFAKLLTALAKKTTDHKEDFVGTLLLEMLAPHTRLHKDPAALLRFVHEMERNGLKISIPASETIMKLLRSAGAQHTQKTEAAEDDRLQKLENTLHKMRDRKLTADSDNDGNFHSSFIKHPREMSLDELECHLIELESKKMNTRGVLRRLLQLCVRDNRLERAVEVKRMCDDLRVQTSPGMLASIFDMYVKIKDLAMAEKSLQQLQHDYPAFQIDEHKLIDYMALLVHFGQMEKAKHLLQQHAVNHRINGGDYVIKNVWQLLTNVAQFSAANAPASGSPNANVNLTHDFFQFLRELRYCNAHNAVLGPIVREWLLRGNVVAAVAEFQSLAEKYKHTPLQFELLSLLVRLGNGDTEELARYAPVEAAQAQQLLGDVTATVTRIHGAVNMNNALLLAFAESGTENQLRRLVINPEFCLNQDQLSKNCEYLGQEGAVRTLLRLARGVRGMQSVIDEQMIYDMLLANFTKSNNCEAALDLYERLEADDELKISQQFVRNLVNLLRVNNATIPSNIALRAQIM